MHRTLKAETARVPESNLREQQKRFDAFRHEYNHIRPHEALQGRRPIERLKSCKRSFPRKLSPFEYPGHYETRSVRSTGLIKWQGLMLFISETLIGERVGLVEIDDGIWSLYFNHIELGRYDERSRCIN